MSIQNVLVIMFLVITLISLIHGLIQGAKKNFFFFILDALFWVLFYFSVNKVADFLLNNVWFYETVINNPEYANMYEYLAHYVADLASIDQAALADPAIKGTITAICACALSLVYLVSLAIVYYVVVKCLIYWIFFARHFRASARKLRSLEREEDRYEKRKDKPNKSLLRKIKRLRKKVEGRPRDKFIGIFTGAFRGALCSFLILCLVNSTVKLLPDLNYSSSDVSMSTEENETPHYASIYDFILAKCGDNRAVIDAVDMIKDYQSSKLINVTSMTINGKSVADTFADSITSGKYTGDKDYSFAIREEISSLVTIAEAAFKLTNGFDMESVDWANLNTTQVGYVQEILTVLSNDQLVVNLASSLVTLGMSMEAVKGYLPKNINEEEYKNINWSEELGTIAILVGDVYSLGNLKKLDYFDLNTEKVETLITDLSKLKSINFLAHVGGNYAIKELSKSNEYELDVQKIENTLADLAVNGDFTNDIASFSKLYTNFINLYKGIDINKYKDENGKISNYVEALTSINVTGYGTLIDTVLEAKFVTELLPDVMEMIRNKIPEDYRSIINPSIVTSAQWKNEIDSALFIINDALSDEDGKNYPFTTIKKYNFGLLKNFSTETVVNSELLSYAMISLMIQTSKEEGVLTAASPYILVPDYLAVDADSNNKFDSHWYGETGELTTMLDSLANIACNIKDATDIPSSLGAMLAAVDADKLLSSDVLYYSLDKTVKKYGDNLCVPVSVTETSTQTINGAYRENTIKRSELKSLIATMSDPNIIDLDALITKDEEGNSSFSMEYDSLMGLFKSKKLYDPENPDTTNLSKLFASDILRATMSHYINDYGSEFIVLLDDAYVNDTLVGKDETVKVIKQQEFVQLMKSISDLDIDIDSLTEDPMKMLDSFKNSDGSLKASVKTMFGYDSATSAYTYQAENGYSSILHATLSKYIINLDSTSLNIVIPNEVVLSDSKRIDGEETVKLINSITHIGVENFTSSSKNQSEIIDDVISELVSDSTLCESVILRATITDYINNNASLEIPSSAKDLSITTVDVISSTEINALLTGLDTIKSGIEAEKGTSCSYTDAMSVDELTLGVLDDAKNNLSESYIIKATMTKTIKDQASNITVPTSAYDANGILTTTETKGVIGSLATVLGREQKINSISIDGIKLKKLTQNATAINSSLIMRATVSKEIIKQSEGADANIKVNKLDSDLIDSTITDCDVLTTTELSNLLNAMDTLFGTSVDTTLSDVSFGDDVIYGKTKSDYATIVSSKVMVYSISHQVEKNMTANTELDFLENLYPKVNGLSYIDAGELTNALYGIGVLAGGSSDAMSSLNINFDDNGGFISTITDTQIEALCDSILISYNIREKLVKTNTNTTGLNNVLVLNTSIAHSSVTTTNYQTVLNGGDYSTYNTSTAQSDICSLFKAFVTINQEGYMDALKGNGSKDDLATYKSEKFVTTITCDAILRDSLPGIIVKLGSLMSSGLSTMIDPADFNIKSRSNFANVDASKAYYYNKGASNTGTTYTDGEFYKFLDFVDAGNSLVSETNATKAENEINRMIACDITSAATWKYLYKSTTISTFNAYATLNSLDLLDKENDTASEYIHKFAIIYASMKAGV